MCFLCVKTVFYFGVFFYFYLTLCGLILCFLCFLLFFSQYPDFSGAGPAFWETAVNMFIHFCWVTVSPTLLQSKVQLSECVSVLQNITFNSLPMVLSVNTKWQCPPWKGVLCAGEGWTCTFHSKPSVPSSPLFSESPPKLYWKTHLCLLLSKPI